MSQYTIWFNKNITATMRMLELLKKEKDANRFKIICTHTDEHNSVAQIADIFEREPDNKISASDYIKWSLEFAKCHKINLFMPGRFVQDLVRNKMCFQQANIHLLASADADMLKILDDKDKTYQYLLTHLTHARNKIYIPKYFIASTLAEFDRAERALKSLGKMVCFKPVIGVSASGFHYITETGDPLDRLMNGNNIAMNLDEVRFYLGQKEKFQPLMVMEYLPGNERSVDCLAYHGSLKQCVTRVKSEQNYQLLEENDNIKQQVELLTSLLNLNGLFNIQFKDDAQAVPYLLEINARMSGGLPKACQAGFNFIYWALRLALEPESVITMPISQANVKVMDVSKAFVV